MRPTREWGEVRELGRVRSERRQQRESQLRARVLALHQEGLTPMLMAERLHIRMDQVRRVMRAVGVKASRKRGN